MLFRSPLHCPAQARAQPPQTPAHTRSEEHLPPDSPPAATPTLAALCSWLGPHPPEDRVGEEESRSLQASGIAALALRGPRVGALKYYSGSGARRSGGFGALSKRDGAGLLDVTPIPPCFAAPAPPRLRPPSRNSAPPHELCPDPPRSGRLWQLGCKCDMEHKTALWWTRSKNGSPVTSTPLLNSWFLPGVQGH